jgi:hypothetical protein
MRITSAGNVGIGEDVPSQKLHVAGGARITNLSSGVVVSDANGVLSISTDLDGTGWGDNLGNHIASQNVRLNGNWLSNDGGNEGIQISNIGNVQLTGSGTIGLTTLADGWFKVGTTLSMDPNEIHFGTDGHFGTIGAYDLMFRSNGSERMRLLANGNFGIGTAAPGGTLHVQGDFYNQELVGQTRYDDDQTVAWNAGATQIDIGSTDYVRVVKADGTGANNSSILVVASVSVSGNTITFADGVGGYQQVYALMNGMATFTVTLQRRINNGSWTNLIRQSAICGIGIGDWYTQYNNIANQQGKHGDEFRFPNSVSLSYFDDPGNGNVDYRLVFTPGGSRKNGGNYLITDRNLTAVQIKR